MFVIPPIPTIGIFVNSFALFKVFMLDLYLVFLVFVGKKLGVWLRQIMVFLKSIVFKDLHGIAHNSEIFRGLFLGCP